MAIWSSLLPDKAFNQLDFQFAMLLPSLNPIISFTDLPRIAATSSASRSDCQTANGGGYNIAGIVGAQALGTDVLDASSFQHGTNRTASDNAGTLWSGLHQHACLRRTRR